MGPAAGDRQSEEEFARRLTLARDGCPVATGELLQACQRFLLFSANQALESTLRPKKAASDLVQDTFVIAHEEFANFRGATLGEFTAWLHTILERRIQNHARAFRGTHRRRIDKEIPVDDVVEPPDTRFEAPDDIELAEESAKVAAALERLPEIYRQVIELRAWQGWKFSQIAERLQRSTQAVEKLWSRAVEKLEQELRDA